MSETRVQTVCLLVLAAIGAFVALDALESVVVPFVLALFVAVLLTPLVNYLVRRLRMRRVLVLIVILIVSFLILGAFGAVMSASVMKFVGNWGVYQNELERNIQTAVDILPLELLGIDPQAEMNLRSLVPMDTLGTALSRTAGSVASLASQTMLVILFLAFLLLGSNNGPEADEGVFKEIKQRVRSYVTAKVLISALTGFCVFLVLLILRIDYAVAFGCFAFWLNFIPNIGSIVASLLPIPVVLLTPEIGPVRMVLALVLPGAVQLVVGNIVEPKVMGESLDMHPVTILLALMLWGTIWGIVGMILAVPITAVIKIVLERIEVTAPIGRLLAGHVGPAKKAAV